MHTRTLNRIFSLLVILVLAATTGAPSSGPAVAQPASPTPLHPAAVRADAPPAGTVVARIYYTSEAEKNSLASYLDVWEVNLKEGYLLAMLPPGQLEALQAAGLRVEIDYERTANLFAIRPVDPNQVDGIPGFDCYRTVEETFATQDQLVADYPTLVQLVDIGNSWDKFDPGGNPGYDMRVLVLTNQAMTGFSKPKLWVMSAIHAREYATAELNTRFAEYLLSNYGTDPDITWMLDFNEVHLLFHMNPDGRKIAETGVDWRKNVDSDDGCTLSYAWGVDLNRNFPFKWGCCGGSSPDPCNDIYRGPYAESEPETTAVAEYARSIFPDQRGPGDNDPANPDTMGAFIDLHSYGGYVMWPWGWTSAPPPDSAKLQTLGRKYAYFNNYDPHQSYTMYATDGTTKEFGYGELGLAAYTWELGTDFFEPCGNFEASIYPDNLQALLYAVKSTRLVYMLPKGPDPLNVSAVPGAVEPGEPVQLTATIDDTRYYDIDGTEPSQDIAAARYSIDAPSWVTYTTPVIGALTATDGAFDEPVEAVQATIDTSSLSSGKHILFVEGQDADGNWGVAGAAFLYVVEPGVAPVIQGYVREAGTNLPLAATVTGGDFTASTDPATGFYSMVVVSGTYDLRAEAVDHAPLTVPDVQAQNYQTIQQDFLLSPICDLFTDNMENGVNGWTAGGSPNTWAQVTSQSHSPTHSWTDSPSGNYSNNANNWVRSPAFDFSEVTGVTLNYWQRYVTETGYDYGFVEYSADGGTTWNIVASFDGTQNAWEQQEFAIPGLDGAASAYIRFHFNADSSQVYDGWYIDDVILSGGGPSCQPLTPPAAEFTSNSPVTLGDLMEFTNTTTGSPPFTWAWDFGDGLGTSTDEHPTYLYLETGTFTVSLTATNSEGSDSVSHPVVVNEATCEPLTGASLEPEFPGPFYTGDPVSILANLLPDGASKPYSYTIDYGDGTAPVSGSSSLDPLALEHTFAAAGTYQVTFSAWNCSPDDPVVATVEVVVWDGGPCVPLSGVEATLVTTGTIYTGDWVTFTLDLAPEDASKPYTYTVDYGDGTPNPWTPGFTDPLTLTHQYLVAGSYTMIFNAQNWCMANWVQDSLPVVVVNEPAPCVPMEAISLTLDTAGPWYPGNAVLFTAGIEPLQSTKPYTYSLDFGDLTQPLTGTSYSNHQGFQYRYQEPGDFEITMSAWNCSPDQVITGTLAVTIDPLPCSPLTGVALSLASPEPVIAGEAATFEVDFSPDEASPPFEYTVTWGDGSEPITGTSLADPLVLSYTFAAAGTYTLRVEAANCGLGEPLATELVVQVEAPGYGIYLPIILNAWEGPPTGRTR